MRKNNCEVIRRELDELMLDESCSVSALDHLRNCSACLEFHKQQTRLRQIVGSLGTVEAPADFDFRLRARLANDSSSTAFHLSSVFRFFARRGFAVVALLIVFAIGVMLVRNVVNRPQPVEIAVENNPPSVRPEPQRPAETNGPKSSGDSNQMMAEGSESSTERVKTGRTPKTGPKSRRSISTAEFSSLGADSLIDSPAGNSATVAVFPIDASLQLLKVSLDDGHGNARTISVPTVRFGSQRILGNGNQFAPKGVW